MEITVYLADDNQIFRQAMIDTVPWKEMSCRLVGESGNGKTAYEEIDALEPDVAFLDIRMPGMSGLEIAGKLNEKNRACKVIIVTGYNDFTYAREGIRKGVFDFLLKPVDFDAIRNVVKRAREALVLERKEKNELETFRKTTGQYEEALRDMGMELRRKLLGDGINGSAEAAERLENLLRIGGYSGYEIMIIQLPVLKKEQEENWIDRYIASWRSQLTNVQKGLGLQTVDAWMDEAMVVLVLFREVMITREYNIMAIRLARALVEKNVAEGHAEICISISNAYQGMNKLPVAYKEAVFAYNSRFFIENRNVIHYASIKSRSVVNDYSLMKKVEQFHDVLRTDPQRLPQILQEIFDTILEKDRYDVSYIRNIFMNMGIMMYCVIADKGKTDIGLKSMSDIMKETAQFQNMTEAFKWLNEYVEKVVELSADIEAKGYSPATKRLLDYLNSHYAEHITLQDAAEHVNLSVSQVCRILKNETGETFITLMNKIRIQAAIRLLKEGGYKVYEVAELTGFGNYAYFYQQFKKVTGCSPTEFH